jgi:hypothetical protein
MIHHCWNLVSIKADTTDRQGAEGIASVENIPIF